MNTPSEHYGLLRWLDHSWRGVNVDLSLDEMRVEICRYRPSSVTPFMVTITCPSLLFVAVRRGLIRRSIIRLAVSQMCFVLIGFNGKLR